MFTKESQPGIKAFFWAGIAVFLMLLDQHGVGLQKMRARIAAPVSSIQYVAGLPFQAIEKVTVMVSSHHSLITENAQLKSEQLLLKAQMQRLLAVESENNQLKALMHSSTQIQGKVLIAQLLAVDSDPFINQILLDKGTHDGVFVGQPVLDADGVMGKIIEANPLTSRVLLINDSHSGIPVQDTRNGVRAIAMGDSYSAKLHLVNVPQTVDMNVGDMLVTSGMGEHYPAGYPVGQVTAVKRAPGLQFSNIEATPSSHSDRSRQVLLVWPNEKPQALDLSRVFK
jgi:rod shape-determining protein MreC